MLLSIIEFIIVLIILYLASVYLLVTGEATLKKNLWRIAFIAAGFIVYDKIILRAVGTDGGTMERGSEVNWAI